MKKRNIILIITAVVLLTVTVVAAVFVLRDKSEQPLSATELLNLGEKYLLELNYEQALVQFLNVIEVEPMNPRGYTGAAEAYIGLGDVENADAILKQGLSVLPGNEEIQSALDVLALEQNQSSSDERTDPLVDSTNTEEPPETGRDGHGVLRRYGYTDFTYSFDWDDNSQNADALGMCLLSFNLTGNTDDVSNVLIWTWKEGDFSDDDIVRGADMAIPIWKENGVGGWGIEYNNSRPVFEDELGKSINVLLLVLDENTEAIGHVIVETQVPAHIPSQTAGSAIVPEPTAFKQYSYSNLSYTFDWNTDFWHEAIGGCTIAFDLTEYNDSIKDVALVTWIDGIESNQIESFINDNIERIKETKATVANYRGDAPAFSGHYRSVDPDLSYDGYMDSFGLQLYSDYLGKTLDVLFAVLDNEYNSIGYLLIPINIPSAIGN